MNFLFQLIGGSPNMAKKQRLVLTSLCLAFFTACSLSFSNTEPNLWKKLASDELASVSAESTLYRKPDSLGVYARVKVENRSKKDIAFDASTVKSLFYINQLVECDEPFRSVVHERRVIPSPWTDTQKVELIERYSKENASAEDRNPAAKDNSLTHLGAGKAFEYYVSFTEAGCEPDSLRKSKCKYVIVVMDGHMNVTDGTAVLPLQRGELDIVGCEFALTKLEELPVIPDGALVLEGPKD